MSIEERLQKLEKELRRAHRRNRLLLAGMVTCIGLGGAVWMYHPHPLLASTDAPSTKEVRAQRFLLMDAKGSLRAALFVDKDGVATLGLNNAKGELRAGLTVDKDGAPALYLYDAKDTLRAALGIKKDLPGLYLYDAEGKQLRTVLGAAGLYLFDAEGKLRWNTP